jgi:hypothetical protein
MQTNMLRNRKDCEIGSGIPDGDLRLKAVENRE